VADEGEPSEWFRHGDGRWVVGDAGRQPQVRASAPTGAAPPDITLDGASVGAVVYRAASLRGLGHQERGEPRQDAYVVRASRDRRWLVGCVSDGVSAAVRAHVGAGIVCSRVTETVLAHLDASTPPTGPDEWARSVAEMPWKQAVEAANDGMLRSTAELLRRAGDRTVGFQEARVLMAATAVAFVVDTEPSNDGDHPATVVNITGDSVGFLGAGDGWTALTTPKDLSGPFVSSAVHAMPAEVDVTPVVLRLQPGQFLVAMTDGLSDPLGAGKGVVGRFLAAQWVGPPDVLEFAQQVGFYRRTFVDDRTAVVVWPAGTSRR
jgi:hypothetical protein